jgi:type II secretory pathway component GspD/PulD (secretin)
LAGNQTTSTTTRANGGTDSSSRSSFGGLGSLGGGYGSGSGGFGGGLGGGFGSGMSSGGGTSLQETQMPKMQSILIGKTLVIVDPPNSTIYASGPPEQLKMLDELITQMDNRPPQLILSAIIGEFTVGDDYSFGLDWVRTMESVGQNAFGGVIKTSQSDSSALKDFSAFGGVKDFLPALQGLTLYSQVGKHLNAFVNTLESTKRFHVLQRPYVAAMNHRKATISTGQQLAIPGQTYSNGTTVGNTGTGFISNTQYIPAELKLEIVPHIFDNREVKLEFVQQNLDVSSYTTISGNKVPNLSTQTLQNTVIVPDGATIVLGGLITERDTGNRTGLPFLARIPILKYIFGSTSNNKERRELMIFVQPRIIADGDDYIQRQLEIEQMNQSYPKNKGFAEPGEPAPLMPVFQNGKLVPRGEPITDDQAAVAGHKDVGERMAKIKPKN